MNAWLKLAALAYPSRSATSATLIWCDSISSARALRTSSMRSRKVAPSAARWRGRPRETRGLLVQLAGGGDSPAVADEERIAEEIPQTPEGRGSSGWVRM